MKADLKTYYIQCMTWKDKKQGCFLHSNAIGCSKTHTVRRHSRGQRERGESSRRQIANNVYADNYNAVDRNDHDTTDYSTTIHTARYYLPIFCWALDRVIHTCYVVVYALALAGMCDPEWHYDQETLEFAWNFPTPSRFPGHSSAVIGTFWLGVVWELENPRQIPGIVPIAINPYLPVARFVRLKLFQWNSSDGG